MPVIPDLHSWTAITKYGLLIVTVFALDESAAKILANEEMKVSPFKESFLLWARDGYMLKDNGAVDIL